MHPDHIVIAGAQKCGTSTLHGYLERHPAIGTAVDHATNCIVKELHFFSGRNWKRGFDWYSGQFTNPHLRSIDATPEYFRNETAAMRLCRVFPRAKVIVSLRNPVTRAISQYNHYRQDMPSTRNWDWRLPDASFEANVNAELNDPFVDGLGLLSRGLYAQQLRYWEKHISRHRVLVLIMEEWSQQPEETYSRLLNFLELEQVEPVQLRPRHQRVHTHEEISNSIISQLTELYRPANEELFEWLGREIPAWQESSTRGS